jgi:DNA repair photolyase
MLFVRTDVPPKEASYGMKLGLLQLRTTRTNALRIQTRIPHLEAVSQAHGRSQNVSVALNTSLESVHTTIQRFVRRAGNRTRKSLIS